MLPGYLPHFLLGQFSQRKLYMGQLILGQGIQDIALVFGSVRRFF